MSKISIGGSAATQRIAVDGHELRSATKAQLSMEAGQLPVLSLELVSIDGIEVETWADVALDDGTKKALIALGWTPPR